MLPATVSTAARINVAGLLVAAGLVAFAPWGWVAAVGVAVPVFLLIGGAIAPTARNNLTDPGEFGQFAGTLLQLAALTVALVAGLLALRTALDRRSKRTR